MSLTVEFVGGPLDGEHRALPDAPIHEVTAFEGRRVILKNAEPGEMPKTIGEYRFRRRVDHSYMDWFPAEPTRPKVERIDTGA